MDSGDGIHWATCACVVAAMLLYVLCTWVVTDLGFQSLVLLFSNVCGVVPQESVPAVVI